MRYDSYLRANTCTKLSIGLSTCSTCTCFFLIKSVQILYSYTSFLEYSVIYVLKSIRTAKIDYFVRIIWNSTTHSFSHSSFLFFFYLVYLLISGSSCVITILVFQYYLFISIITSSLHHLYYLSSEFSFDWWRCTDRNVSIIIEVWWYHDKIYERLVIVQFIVMNLYITLMSILGVWLCSLYSSFKDWHVYVHAQVHKHVQTRTGMHTCTWTHTCTTIHTYIQDGFFPLSNASQEGYDKIVRVLLQAGATVDLQNKVEDWFHFVHLSHVVCYVQCSKHAVA